MSASLFRTSIRTPVFLSGALPLLPRVASRGMSDHSTRHGNDPEVIQRNKESLLRKHRKDSTEAPHWHEELASDAEAFVKSQREEIEVSESEIVRLQENTKKQLDPKSTTKRQ